MLYNAYVSCSYALSVWGYNCSQIAGINLSVRVIECLCVYDAEAPYFPTVCLVCSREQRLHTLVRVIYRVPHTLTPIIETYSGKPLAAHYPILNDITLPTHAITRVRGWVRARVHLCVSVCSSVLSGVLQKGTLFVFNICSFLTREKERQRLCSPFVHKVTNGDMGVWKRTREGAAMSVKGLESVKKNGRNWRKKGGSGSV